MSYQPAVPSPNDPPDNPYHHCLMASRNFWAGYSDLNASEPPPPSIRMVKGKPKLGRYLDFYGCQALMEREQRAWTRWYTGFFVSIGLGALFSAIDFVFVFIALPIFIVWYLAVKLRYYLPYSHYWKIQQEINRTGKPVWEPYSRHRRNVIDHNPMAVWP